MVTNSKVGLSRVVTYFLPFPVPAVAYVQAVCFIRGNYTQNIPRSSTHKNTPSLITCVRKKLTLILLFHMTDDLEKCVLGMLVRTTENVLCIG